MPGIFRIPGFPEALSAPYISHSAHLQVSHTAPVLQALPVLFPAQLQHQSTHTILQIDIRLSLPLAYILHLTEDSAHTQYSLPQIFFVLSFILPGFKLFTISPCRKQPSSACCCRTVILDLTTCSVIINNRIRCPDICRTKLFCLWPCPISVKPESVMVFFSFIKISEKSWYSCWNPNLLFYRLVKIKSGSALLHPVSPHHLHKPIFLHYCTPRQSLHPTSPAANTELSSSRYFQSVPYMSLLIPKAKLPMYIYMQAEFYIFPQTESSTIPERKISKK